MNFTFTRMLVRNFREWFRFYPDEMGFGTEKDTYADFGVGGTNISLFEKHEMSEVVGHSKNLSDPKRRITFAWSLAWTMSTRYTST